MAQHSRGSLPLLSAQDLRTALGKLHAVMQFMQLHVWKPAMQVCCSDVHCIPGITQVVLCSL